MSYKVLARKWRPQMFSNVIGQEHVLTALTNSLKRKRLHHAYLFSGTRGVGKTTIARLFVKGLNCKTGITQNPCSKCDNCLEIEHGRFVDLIEIDAASRTKVEDTRELLDNVQYAPVIGRFKVYLIDEVHMLSRHSFNALLKTLEEPPKHVKFLLATTDSKKLPITILSRCLQFHLKLVDVDKISSQLEHILETEKISSNKRVCQLIARAAKGSLRDALSLTDQAIAMEDGNVSVDSVRKMLGILDIEYPLAIIEAIVHSDSQKMMSLIEDVHLRGDDWENVLIEMLSLIHRIAMIQFLPIDMQDKNTESLIDERLRFLASLIMPTDLQYYYQILLLGRKDLPFSPEKRIGVEMTLLRALAFHPKYINDVEISSKEESVSLTELTSIDNNIDNHIDNSTILKDKKKVFDKVKLLSNNKFIDKSRLQLLKAKALLNNTQDKMTRKNPNTALLKTKTRLMISNIKNLPIFSVKHQRSILDKSKEIDKIKDNKFYQYFLRNIFKQKTERVVTNISDIKEKLTYEMTYELSNKISFEARKRDKWSSEIFQLKMPKWIEQIALNSYKKELSETEVCLHLRSMKRYLNTDFAYKTLKEVLSKLYAKPIKLMIIEDDNLDVKTPVEWQNIIYEEKLFNARKSIFMDKKIHSLCSLFDAQLDEESIRPI